MRLRPVLSGMKIVIVELNVMLATFQDYEEQEATEPQPAGYRSCRAAQQEVPTQPTYHQEEDRGSFCVGRILEQ